MQIRRNKLDKTVNTAITCIHSDNLFTPFTATRKYSFAYLQINTTFPTHFLPNHTPITNSQPKYTITDDLSALRNPLRVGPANQYNQRLHSTRLLTLHSLTGTHCTQPSSETEKGASKMSTAPGIPSRSPMQVLTRPNVA